MTTSTQRSTIFLHCSDTIYKVTLCPGESLNLEGQREKIGPKIFNFSSCVIMARTSGSPSTFRMYIYFNQVKRLSSFSQCSNTFEIKVIQYSPYPRSSHTSSSPSGELIFKINTCVTHVINFFYAHTQADSFSKHLFRHLWSDAVTKYRKIFFISNFLRNFF